MRNDSGDIPTIWILVILAAIAAAGIGIQFWLVDVSADDMTPAYENLLTTADWMLKVAFGAFLGLAAGAWLAGRNGRRRPGQA